MQHSKITPDHVQTAVNLADFDCLPAHRRMAPGSRELIVPNTETPPREAGVLVLLYPEPETLHIVLTRRVDHLRGHAGQVSFPGGKRDPEDPTFIATALRETEEELGILPDDVTILGTLSQIYIPPSHYLVNPVVGFLEATPYFRPNPDEVAEVFSVSLSDLLNDHYKHHEFREFKGTRVKIPFYSVRGHKVWGATAVMLSELEARLRHVMCR